MSVPTVTFYQSDFGPVELGPYATTLPLRKRGTFDFDMRYARCRAFVAILNAMAEHVYKTHKHKMLTYFDFDPSKNRPILDRPRSVA